MSHDEYINNVIIPLFQPLVNEDIMACIYDCNGKVLISTEQNALSVGLSSAAAQKGTSFNDVNPALLEQMLGDLSEYNVEKIIQSCQKMQRLITLVVEKKKIVNIIDMLPYDNKYRSYLVTLVPIFHPDSSVVAVNAISVIYKMVDMRDVILDANNESFDMSELSIPNSIPPIDLAPRQHEILYLILQGIPQEYAAQILNIKRGTLARIISEQICPKFGIHGSNTKLLVERAMKMGLQNYMPKSLWFPGVIILDEEISQIVNSEFERSV